jgi:hypothetical protein
MKRSIITILVATLALNGFAKDATIMFADGSRHTYQEIPEEVTIDRIETRAMKDFPSRKINNISIDVPSGSGAMEKEEVCGTGCKIIIGVIVFAAARYAIAHAHKIHPCSSPTDRAADGSLCGARASSIRPGGLP